MRHLFAPSGVRTPIDGSEWPTSGVDPLDHFRWATFEAASDQRLLLAVHARDPRLAGLFGRG
jgi:hypothetical protein